jgi:hypothetical protein
MKMTVFCNVVPCSLTVYRLSIGAYCIHRIALMMGAVSTSETSVKFYQTTRYNIPEDCRLHGMTRPQGCGSGWLYPNMGVWRTDPDVLNEHSQPEIIHKYIVNNKYN